MDKTASTAKGILKTVSLTAVIFLTVSGGPYGLEPLTQFAGKNGALLLLLLVPLLWDLPTILTVLELNSIMPVNGGYYKWVERAMGKRWAFYEAWWSWLYSFTDLAIYPVLFVTYISFLYPALVAYKVLICVTIIWSCAGLNIVGIVPVGRVSLFLSAVIVIPFLILYSIAFANSSTHLSIPPVSFNGVGFSALGMCLYTIMWNFLGWDNTTTYAGEVSKPVKSYLVSTFTAFGIVIVLYLITTYITVNAGVSFSELSDAGYPLLGVKLAGQWLGVLLSIGGMASALGIFSAVMLSISRVPKEMADDKMLPKILAKLHPKFNTPYITILITAFIVSLMTVWKFTELIVIDVILYGAGITLEFISLIRLRIKEPDIVRPFKIPLNTFFLCLMIVLPIAIYTIALIGVLSKDDSNVTPAYFALIALVTAEVGWQVIRWRSKKTEKII